MSERYQYHENIPYGWEVTDTQAIPARTFVVGLTEAQAQAIARECNELAENRT
jgi:hypothetical protein